MILHVFDGLGYAVVPADGYLLAAWAIGDGDVSVAVGGDVIASGAAGTPDAPGDLGPADPVVVREGAVITVTASAAAWVTLDLDHTIAVAAETDGEAGAEGEEPA